MSGKRFLFMSFLGKLHTPFPVRENESKCECQQRECNFIFETKPKLSHLNIRSSQHNMPKIPAGERVRRKTQRYQIW